MADEAQNDGERQLTFGEQAVGVSFNPSQDENVKTIKENYAKIIDHLNDLRSATEDGEQKRLLSVAITEAQGAQMWAVKGATWLLGKGGAK